MSTQSLEENYVSLLNFIKAFESLKGKQSLRVEECSPLFYAEEIPLFEDYVWVHDALRPAEETVEEETEKKRTGYSALGEIAGERSGAKGSEYFENLDCR